MNSRRHVVQAVQVSVMSLSLTSFSGPVAAHSWYPSECCEHDDCIAADDITIDRNGDFAVRVGTLSVWVPREFAVRSSPDGRVHVCFRVDETGFPTVFCLFRPAES